MDSLMALSMPLYIQLTDDRESVADQALVLSGINQ